MFICQQCYRQTQPGEKAYSLVLETRVHVHPERTYRVRRESQQRTDCGGTGTQIVRELRVCIDCAGAEVKADRPARAPLDG
jgi:hypothetical protein